MKTTFIVTNLFLISAAAVVWVGAVMVARRAPAVIRVSIATPVHR